MAPNREKYDIEVQNDDAIKRNELFFDFIQQMFNSQYGLYLNEKCSLNRYDNKIPIKEAECIWY